MAWSLIAHTAAQAASSAQAITTGSIDCTGADLIVVFVNASGPTANTVSDSKGNTYSHGALNAPGGNKVQWFYVHAPAVGAMTFTYDPGASYTYPSMAVAAFSGSASTPFDVESSAYTYGSPVQPGSLTASAGELLLTAIGGAWASGISCNTGTILNVLGCTLGENAVGLYYIGGTLGQAYNPTWSRSGTGNDIDAAMVLFKAASGGGTQYTKTLTGSTAKAGALARQIRKIVSGSTAKAGALIKSIHKIVTGSAAKHGVLVRQVHKTLPASATKAAVLKRALFKHVTAAISRAAIVAKHLSKTFTASMAKAGALNTRLGVTLYHKTLTASVSLQGAIAFAGTFWTRKAAAAATWIKKKGL